MFESVGIRNCDYFKTENFFALNEKLTLGFVKISGSFMCGGMKSLTPSFGGSDWLLL